MTVTNNGIISIFTEFITLNPRPTNSKDPLAGPSSSPGDGGTDTKTETTLSISTVVGISIGCVLAAIIAVLVVMMCRRRGKKEGAAPKLIVGVPSSGMPSNATLNAASLGAVDAGRGRGSPEMTEVFTESHPTLHLSPTRQDTPGVGLVARTVTQFTTLESVACESLLSSPSTIVRPRSPVTANTIYNYPNTGITVPANVVTNVRNSMAKQQSPSELWNSATTITSKRAPIKVDLGPPPPVSPLVSKENLCTKNNVPTYASSGEIA
ncbi:hypothetical protein HDU67_005623, partial [Dinochytrium kinnereticum]